MTVLFARTPPPPYTAVIFTSQRRDADHAEYAMAADRMAELVVQQPGYLGMESVRDATGLGITVSYWTSPGAAAAWKAQAEHRLTQDRGRKAFYESYALRICEVHREATFDGSVRAERFHESVAAVIPAEAGIPCDSRDPRLRGDDTHGGFSEPDQLADARHI